MGLMTQSPLKDASKIFLLAENRLLRDALSHLLHKKSGICVVGASSYTDCDIAQISASGCMILLLDNATTILAQSDLVGEVLRTMPHLRILLVGMEDDQDSFLRAVRSGIIGYVLKEASALDVVAAVRTVARGDAVCPAQYSRSLFRYIAKDSQEIPVYRAKRELGLTRRQQQLVTLIAKGWTNKEIAGSLNLSEQTVKNHIHRILKQLKAENRYEAVETVKACGLLA